MSNLLVPQDRLASLRLDQLVFGTVLAWARFRFDCCARAIVHGITFASSDRLEGLRVTFSVELEPFMVSEKFVLLLRFVYFLLIGKKFLLSTFLVNLSV